MKADRHLLTCFVCWLLFVVGLCACHQDDDPNGPGPALPGDDPVEEETDEPTETETDLGTTTERPPPTPDPVPPSDDTPSTSGGPGCRVTAHFVFQLNRISRRFRDWEPGFELDSRAVPMIRIIPVPEGIGNFPGTLTISVTQAGRPVAFTDESGNPFQTTDPFTTTITLGVLEETPLKREIRRVDRELEGGNAGYRLRAPAGLNAANPTALQTVVATASWTPQDGTPCTESADLDILWTSRLGGTITRPIRDSQGKNHLRATGLTRPFQDSDGNDFVVAPIYHYWEVTDPYDCCGEPDPYQVIQFARVVYDDEGNMPPFQKGHQWALDIRETEKERARNGDPYDPTFTNDPRGTNPGGSMVNPAPGGRSSIRQEDAPGMTRQRYDELVASPEEVKVTWQFMAFLVCPPDVEDGENPAEIYLAEAEVCRVAIYEVVWTFPGHIGAPPVIDARLKEVYPSGRKEVCTQDLAAWITANGLNDAYNDPPEARANDMNDADHNALSRAVARLGLQRP